MPERFGGIESTRECYFGQPTPKPFGEWLSDEEAEWGSSPQAFGSILSSTQVTETYGQPGGEVELGYLNPSRQPPVIYPSTRQQCAVSFGAGAWGSWAQVEASTGVDTVLQQLLIGKVVGSSGSIWVQIGIGAVNEEVPVATIGDNVFIAGSGSAPLVVFDKRLSPIPIPAGTRIVVRGWSNVGHAAGSVMLINLPNPASWVTPWPDTYIEGGRSPVLSRLPVVPNWLAISTTWTQVIAAAASDILLDGAEFNAMVGGGGTGNVLQVAVGAIGEEVTITEIPFVTAGLFSFLQAQVRTVRRAQILVGERVVARWVASVPASPQTAFNLELLN